MGAYPTVPQISAGGLPYRQEDGQIWMAIISVGLDPRWQLAKGVIDRGESPEQAAIREVREETGLQTEAEELLEKVEYWYYGQQGGKRVRFHKQVYFYLMAYRSGEVVDHDQEVNEARWVLAEEAISMLTFDSEKNVARKALENIRGKV